MEERANSILRIVGLLAIGLVPGVAAFALAPSRGLAIGATGTAAMGVGWVLWVSRLVADAHHVQQREAALRGELSSLEEKLESQTRELRDLRTRDAVTGTLNRSGLLLRLNETIARDARLGQPVCFLLVDIEGFKEINIERGRIGGDATLMRVSRALESATRGTDCVGRLGGDEFGVVLTECDDPGPAVNRVFKALQASTDFEGATTVHVAIGAVTIEDPASGVEVQELFRLAEGALASVRGTGGSLCARRTLRGDVARRATSA
jgi:diguanylate cyclase (GGDEF)-like protein